jgi:hypothetical protein
VSVRLLMLVAFDALLDSMPGRSQPTHASSGRDKRPATRCLLTLNSEAEKAISRYDEWVALREEAIANHAKTGSTQPLPLFLQTELPPRPAPYEEEMMTDVSVDMTANGFDGESFTLDRSLADDAVPVADPGLERPSVSVVWIKE